MPRRTRQRIDDAALLDLLEQISGVNREAPPSLADQFMLVMQARGQAADPTTIDRWLLYEIDELRQGLDEARHSQTELRRLHEHMTSPPWFTGVFLRAIDGTPARAVVAYQQTPRVVVLGENLAIERLSAGDDVLLTSDLNMVLDKLTPSVTRACEVADFVCVLADGRVMLKSHDGEVVVRAAGAFDATALTPGARVRWDPALAIAYESLPRSATPSPFIVDTPTERFEDIGGLDPVIARLKRAVRLHVQHPEVAARYGLKRASSVLLVGPPGTGKTMLARGLAHWLGELSAGGRARFLSIKPNALSSMWWGQSEANYREVFRAARELGEADPSVPVVLFFDEVDSIGTTRSTGTAARVDDRVLTSFMTELDGLEPRGNVLVAAATNRRDALDPALLRPGRLGDMVVEIPRPNRAAARSILERHMPLSAPYVSDEAALGRHDVLERTISTLYAPNGLGEVATLTFRDGSRQALHACDLVNGAMLANIARVAIERASVRDIDTGEVGITAADALDAAADEVASAVATLTPTNCHAHVAGLPQDMSVVRVEPTRNRPRRPHRFLSVA